jgi:hypothetical protein
MSKARLSAAFQAVEVTLTVDGRPVRGIVSRAVFEQQFGAGSEPASWLAAYRDHAPAIDAALRRQADLHPGHNMVVLLEPDGAAS